MRDPIKVYDARWEVDEFNDSEVRRLFEATLGYARLINVDTIVITRDVRQGCARVIDIGLSTAINAGFRVFTCFDPISTPLSYFVAMQTTIDYPNTMGLTITASHNPKQYVGVKFTIPTVQAIGYGCGPFGGLKKIKELYHSKDYVLKEKAGGSLHIIKHPADSYIQYSMEAAGVKPGDFKKLKIVLDAFNGSAGAELYQAFTIAGAKIIPLRIVPNGDFPTGSPNPTSQNKMNNAIQVANQQDADIVIGVDGDGDRMVFGDKTGLFSAGFVMIPILKTILSSEKKSDIPKILYDPKVNPFALEKWAELNVMPVLFRNGHSQIKWFMKDIQALAGAEESGHFYHQLKLSNIQVMAENSLFTILLFLNAINKQPSILKELRNYQNTVYTSGEFNYEFQSNDIRDKAMAGIIKYFENDGAKLTSHSENGDDLEGTVVYKGVNKINEKVILDKKWYSAYVRTATNEKGVVRSYISSGNDTFGKSIQNEIVKILKDEFNGKQIE